MLYQNVYQHFNSLTAISEEEWLLLESKLTYRSFKKGELFQPQLQEKKRDLVALVMEGHFSVSHFSEDGEERIKYFADPFDLVGDYPAILQNNSSKIIVRSLTKSKTLLISYSEFKCLAASNTSLLKLENKVLQKLYLLKEKREHSFLVFSARERYQQFQEEFPHLKDVIPQKQVATYIGITPTSLSRLLKN